MVMACRVLVFLLEIIFTLLAVSSSEDGTNSYEDFYLRGMDYYFDNKWLDTINTMEKAVKDYDTVKEVREKCYKQCSNESIDIRNDYANNDQYYFFHKIIQKSLCRKQCKKALLGDRPSRGVSQKLEKDMSSGVPFNFMQVALFKENRITEAAAYVATYHYLDHHSEVARRDVQFYESRDDVSKSDLKPFKTKSYRDLYEEGQRLYESGDNEEMVKTFELSLKAFFDEIEKCRTECEGPMKFTGGHEFSEALWSVHLSYLECKHSCPEKLGEFRQENSQFNFFGSFYHYLTYGYFHLSKMVEAARALTTHLRIEPKSQVAKMNSAYIKQQPGVSLKDFVERQDTKDLLNKMEKEAQLLQIMRETGSKGPSETPEEDKDDAKLLEEDYEKFPIKVKEEAKREDVEENKAEDKKKKEKNKPEQNFTIVETAADHHGIERLVIDNLLTKSQCQALIELAKSTKEGDGYQAKSPHTPYEKFEGLNILDAAEAAIKKQVELEQVQLYINASKAVKSAVAEQFELPTTLYFSYTHLVCRTAKDNGPSTRNDLSHPVHADNCILTDGECIKKSPAYTWRDYSAILYLNGDFEGGKFFFAHSTKDLTPQHYVQPTCGRMVGFSAGKENMHGVTPVTKGRRCAVALWFTLDPVHQETSFIEAEVRLNRIS